MSPSAGPGVLLVGQRFEAVLSVGGLALDVLEQDGAGAAVGAAERGFAQGRVFDGGDVPFLEDQDDVLVRAGLPVGRDPVRVVGVVEPVGLAAVDEGWSSRDPQAAGVHGAGADGEVEPAP